MMIPLNCPANGARILHLRPREVFFCSCPDPVLQVPYGEAECCASTWPNVLIMGSCLQFRDFYVCAQKSPRSIPCAETFSHLWSKIQQLPPIIVTPVSRRKRHSAQHFARLRRANRNEVSQQVIPIVISIADRQSRAFQNVGNFH
jgi:hypothetical protein